MGDQQGGVSLQGSCA